MKQQHAPDEHREIASFNTNTKFNRVINEDIDFNVPGVPHSTVKQLHGASVRDLIQKIENHPNRHALQRDLQQSQPFNPFSQESKEMIHDVGNVELCELLDMEPKAQCKVCLSYWDVGIVYCTCGHFLRNGTEENRKFLAPDGYPAELCKQLAHKVLLAAVNRRTVMLRFACSKVGVHTSRPGVAHLPCERVSSDNPCKVLLTPRVSEVQDLECLGGLRSCRRVRLRMPVSCARGLLIRRALENMLTQIPGLESRCLCAIGSDMDEAGPTAQDLASARAALADLLPGTITFPLPSTTSSWQP